MNIFKIVCLPKTLILQASQCHLSGIEPQKLTIFSVENFLGSLSDERTVFLDENTQQNKKRRMIVTFCNVMYTKRILLT